MRNFLCHLCGKAFKTKTEQVRHIRALHNAEISHLKESFDHSYEESTPNVYKGMKFKVFVPIVACRKTGLFGSL